MEPLSGDVTRLLRQVREGVEEAKHQLFTLLYDEIYRIARAKMRSERRNHTLQPTEVVNEAYARLVEQPQQCWQSRAHFKATCACIIGHLLVDHARKKKARKRGGDIEFVPLDESIAGPKKRPIVDTLAFYEALERLEKINPRQGQIIQYTRYGEMTDAEIAHVLGISEKTVERDRKNALAWLILILHKK
jgi:RNA polymerase sigma factor (TIGR02999 family)